MIIVVLDWIDNAVVNRILGFYVSLGKKKVNRIFVMLVDGVNLFTGIYFYTESKKCVSCFKFS